MSKDMMKGLSYGITIALVVAFVVMAILRLNALEIKIATVAQAHDNLVGMLTGQTQRGPQPQRAPGPQQSAVPAAVPAAPADKK